MEEKLRAAASSSMIISFTSTAFIYHMYSHAVLHLSS
jgi:hypothetical protein